MAANGDMNFRVRHAAEVRQAPSRTSALFHTVQAGKHVKLMGKPVKMGDGLRVPLLPRGWIDAEALDGFPGVDPSALPPSGGGMSSTAASSTTAPSTPSTEQSMSTEDSAKRTWPAGSNGGSASRSTEDKRTWPAGSHGGRASSFSEKTSTGCWAQPKAVEEPAPSEWQADLKSSVSSAQWAKPTKELEDAAETTDLSASLPPELLKDGMIYVLRCKAEVRQAPSPQSPVFFVAQEGMTVKQMGTIMRLAGGAVRVPLQPRGWIDATVLRVQASRRPPGLDEPGAEEREPNGAATTDPKVLPSEWLGGSSPTATSESNAGAPVVVQDSDAMAETGHAKTMADLSKPPGTFSTFLQPETTGPEGFSAKSAFVKAGLVKDGSSPPGEMGGGKSAASNAGQLQGSADDELTRAIADIELQKAEAKTQPGAEMAPAGYPQVAKAKSSARTQMIAVLNRNIEDYLRFTSEASGHSDSGPILLNTLSVIMNQMGLPGDVKIFGSCATALKSGSSDIDITYAGDIEAGSIPSVIVQFATLLPDFGFQNVTRITQSNIPLVKFTDPRSGIEVDFCLHNDLGIRNSLLLDCYCRCDPRVAQLGRLVKDWAKRHELVGTADGLLNSYAYMLLTIYYLQVIQPPVVPNLQSLAMKSVPIYDNKWGVDDKWETKFFEEVEALPPSQSTKTIAELLIGFFRFYTQTCNWSAHAVCLRLSQPGCAIDKFSLATPTFPEQWYVEDPFDLKHNLAGRCSSRGRELILSEMRQALSSLTASAGSLKEVCHAQKQETFFLRCRIFLGLSAEAVMQHFRPFGLTRLHYPQPVGGRMGQAFLEFGSAADRRRAHAENESVVGDSQLQLMSSTRHGLAEAKEDFVYEVFELASQRAAAAGAASVQPGIF